MSNRSETPAKTTDLRKFAASLGIKGMSSANKATLTEVIGAHFDKIEKIEAEAAKPAKAKKVPSASTRNNGICDVCQTAKVNKKTQGLDSSMCLPCFEEAGIENEHLDGLHTDDPSAECPMCFPVTVPNGPQTLTSRKFVLAALRKGWKVEITDLSESSPENPTGAFEVRAEKDGSEIVLTFRDRAFQYYSKESFRTSGGKRALLLNASQAHKYL
jgi:hypothetical protein